MQRHWLTYISHQCNSELLMFSTPRPHYEHLTFGCTGCEGRRYPWRKHRNIRPRQQFQAASLIDGTFSLIVDVKLSARRIQTSKVSNTYLRFCVLCVYPLGSWLFSAEKWSPIDIRPIAESILHPPCLALLVPSTTECKYSFFIRTPPCYIWTYLPLSS